MVKKSMAKKPDWRSRPRPWARKPDDERKSCTIEVSLTIAQRERLQAMAEQMGISLAEVCRRSLAYFADGLLK